MTDRELMQQALDAMLNFPNDISDEMFESIRVLRARLAQPEPEVKWDASAPLVVHPHPAFQATQPQPDLAAVGEVGIWGERQWQGLTDAEIRGFEIWLDDEEEKHGWNPPADIVKYIEAKLKQKNAL